MQLPHTESQFTIMADGSLLITLWTPENKPDDETLEEWCGHAEKYNYMELIEGTICNSSFDFVRPVQVGALIDDDEPIITFGAYIADTIGKTGPGESVFDDPVLDMLGYWHYPMSAIRNPWEELVNNGWVIFALGPMRIDYEVGAENNDDPTEWKICPRCQGPYRAAMLLPFAVGPWGVAFEPDLTKVTHWAISSDEVYEVLSRHDPCLGHMVLPESESADASILCQPDDTVWDAADPMLSARLLDDIKHRYGQCEWYCARCKEEEGQL